MRRQSVIERKWLAALIGGMLAMPAAAWAQTPAPVADGETIGTPELVQKACAEGQVVYYTPDAEAQTRAISAVFEKRFPCIKVLTVSAVTGRLIERLSAEIAAAKIQADVVLLNDLQALDKFKGMGAIHPWNPPADDKYPAASKLSGWWYGAGGTMEYIAYNTNLVSAADAPKSWKDVLDPKWKGKISAPTVSIGGTGWVQYYFLSQKYGDDFLTKFAAQKPKYFSSYQPLTLAAARGEVAIALTAVSIEAPMRADGAPLQPVYPADGIPVATTWMALMSHSPHPNAALLYANWALSKEGQAAQVKVRRIWSQRPDVPAAAGNPPVSSINFFTVPSDLVIREYGNFAAKATKLLGLE
jgi:iron(III) transport system substrate-binding protein